MDIETRGRVEENIWSHVATASERDALAQLSVGAAREQATRLVSAKEAFYKAQFQVTRGWLGFQDAAVVFEGSAFELTLQVDTESLAGRGAVFRGEQRYTAGCVLSLVWIR